MHALLSDSEKDELFYAHYSSFTLPVTYFFLLLFSWQIIKVVHENILIRPWVSLAFDVRFSGKRNCVSEIEGKKESVLDNAIYSCLSFLFIFPEINLLNKLRACVAKKYRTQLCKKYRETKIPQYILDQCTRYFVSKLYSLFFWLKISKLNGETCHHLRLPCGTLPD